MIFESRCKRKSGWPGWEFGVRGPGVGQPFHGFRLEKICRPAGNFPAARASLRLANSPPRPVSFEALVATFYAKGLWAMSFQIGVQIQIAQNRFAYGSRLGLEDRGEEIISQST
jgi:hypothetical protein